MESPETPVTSGNPVTMKAEWDKSVPGLGIRRNQKGLVWILKYRSSGKQLLVTLGPVDLISVDEARALAQRLKWEAKQGNGPQPKPRLLKKTVAELCSEYLERYARPRKKSWYKDEERIRGHIIPALGKHQVRDVTQADIANLHSKIGAKTPTTANRTLENLHKMFKLAVQWGYLPAGSINPAKGIERFPEVTKTRSMNKKELSRAIQAIDRDLPLNRRIYFWLLLITGARKTEILTLKWSDVDLDNGFVNIGITKNGEPHTLPLPANTLQMLRGLPRDSEWVFTGRKGQHWKRPDKIWWEIRDRIDLRDVSLHTFRHTCASLLLQKNYPLKVVGEVLNHRSLTATNRYAHLEKEHLRNVLEDHAINLFQVSQSDEDEAVSGC